MTRGDGMHRRRSIRLQGYDYTQAGGYFITICTQNRERLFGDIMTVGATPCGCPVLTDDCPVSTPVVARTMVLNDAGRMIQTVWDEIPMHYARMEIDEFVVMPNHIHGIVIIDPVRATPRGCPDPDIGTCGQAQGPAPTDRTAPLSLGDIVHRFKTMTTKRYADGVKQSGWQPFEGRLWQRNYWEHVVRDEMELNRIREYIRDNPAQWDEDRMNLDKSTRLPRVHEPDVAYTPEGWMV